ncbi:MAG: hypothetical protein NT167_14090, partial [Verrucomicrobia bacterium]|nr:hypothetical protein [Verrucomicrobiota bacterium]
MRDAHERQRARKQEEKSGSQRWFAGDGWASLGTVVGSVPPHPNPLPLGGGEGGAKSVSPDCLRPRICRLTAVDSPS